MDPHGHIYKDDPENIPEEDKARLEGFLEGRAESDAKRKEAVAEFERKLEELRKARDA